MSPLHNIVPAQVYHHIHWSVEVSADTLCGVSTDAEVSGNAKVSNNTEISAEVIGNTK